MYTIEAIQEKVKQSFGEQNFMDEPKLLYEPIAYTLANGGKRLRPVLLLAACDLFDGDCNQALNAAIGIEIFHNFTLLHDDIMDKSAMRRGKETVYKKFNSNKAILSGDTMFALAFKHLLNYENEIVKDLVEILTQSSIEVCEGQAFDMEFETRNDVKIEEYINSR